MAVISSPEESAKFRLLIYQQCHREWADYEATRQPTKLDAAIASFDSLIEIMPMMNTATLDLGGNLTNSLFCHFERTTIESYLNQAIRLGLLMSSRPALPSDAETLLQIQSNMCGFQLMKAHRTAAEEDLDLTLGIARNGLEIATRGSPNYNNLQMCLWQAASKKALLFQYMDLEAIEFAIVAVEQALQIMPTSYALRHQASGSLGRLLARRSTMNAPTSSQDQNKAIQLLQQSLAGTQEVSEHTLCLVELTKTLALRFQFHGQESDLELALEYAHKALVHKALVPRHNIRVVHFAANTAAGMCYEIRYMTSFSTADLDLAIRLMETSLPLVPGLDDPYMHICMLSLAGLYYHRSLRILPERFKWATEAVRLQRIVCDATPHDHPQWRLRLSQLGTFLQNQPGSRDNPSSLQECLCIAKKVLTGAPQKDPYRWKYLLERAHMGEQQALFGTAIVYYEESLALAGPVHYGRDRTLTRLAGCYARVAHLISQDNVVETDSTAAMTVLAAVQSAFTCKSVQILLEVLRSSDALTDRRILAGVIAAVTLMSMGLWDRAYITLQTVIRLTNKLNSRHLTRLDQQYHVGSQLLSVSSWAAYCSLEIGRSAEEALACLEDGRGLIAKRLLDNRIEAPDLKDAYPGLWQRYMELRDRAAAPEQAYDFAMPGMGLVSGPAYDALSERCRKHRDRAQNILLLDSLEQQIRHLDGFETFAMAPRSRDLLSVADRGPVVFFNTTQFATDAFLVTVSGIKVLRLQEMDMDKIKSVVRCLTGPSRLSLGRPRTMFERNMKLREILRWLWNSAVHPVLRELGLLSLPLPEKPPRLWWVANGLIGLLPLHAAGIYGKGSEEYTSSYVVSSFIPSIRALSFARNSKLNASDIVGESFVFVGMPNTASPARNKPLNISEELAELVAVFEIDNKMIQPEKGQVLSALEKCTAVHMSCHGIASSSDPSQSALLLGSAEADRAELMTVQEIAELRLEKAQLAYLSACSTAQSEFEELADEAIHMAGTLHLLGFSHVIGTLWEISDAVSRKTARRFYDNVKLRASSDRCRENNDVVALALHDAIDVLRKDDCDDFIRWVPYIHIGP
jgi:tetratricopeptide (TPR) repeat protein